MLLLAFLSVYFLLSDNAQSGNHSYSYIKYVIALIYISYFERALEWLLCLANVPGETCFLGYWIKLDRAYYSPQYIGVFEGDKDPAPNMILVS